MIKFAVVAAAVFALAACSSMPSRDQVEKDIKAACDTLPAKFSNKRIEAVCADPAAVVDDAVKAAALVKEIRALVK